MRAEDIEKMVATDALHYVGDDTQPGVHVLMVSRGGKIYALSIDQELSLDGFTSTSYLHNSVPMTIGTKGELEHGS